MSDPILIATYPQINSTISFTTYHPHQIATIVGKVVSVCDYKTASLVGDLINYHLKCVSNGLVAEDDEYLNYTYVIVEDQNQTSLSSSTKLRRAYALAWMRDGVYTVINTVNTVDIRLFNVTQAQVESVVEYLFDQHICSKIIV